MAVSAAYRRGPLLLALDYENSPRIGENDAAFGVEFQAYKGMFVRGGYGTKGSIGGGSGFDAAKGLTLGLGADLRGFRLDYAIKPTGELGRAHRFDIGCRF